MSQQISRGIQRVMVRQAITSAKTAKTTKKLPNPFEILAKLLGRVSTELPKVSAQVPARPELTSVWMQPGRLSSALEQ
jgi:hypothetical protein